MELSHENCVEDEWFGQSMARLDQRKWFIESVFFKTFLDSLLNFLHNSTKHMIGCD